MMASLDKKLIGLDSDLGGDVRFDDLHKVIYATDASVYRELPTAVAYPKSEEDLIRVVNFCREEGLPIIARAAGTSLAGQVVGNGLICDTSRYLTGILNIDAENKTVTVQPGVIRDVLNARLVDHGLFFGPNTSTSNRCMIGGMIGNNSCGSTSIKYGHTRDKIRSVRTILSNGEVAIFDDNDQQYQGGFKAEIIRSILNKYGNPGIRQQVISAFPDPAIKRRNTGYALDTLCLSQPFTEHGSPFNLAKLLCGSEGTLALTSEATLTLDDLPPEYHHLVVLEFDSIKKALESIVPIMAFEPYQCELMDEIILNCTMGHPTYGTYLDLLKGHPKAVVMVELRGHTEDELEEITSHFCREMNALGAAEGMTIHKPENANKMWALRSAGLGLLANVEGDKKAVACIEDTAVSIQDLPQYIDEFEKMMQSFGQKAVYFAHAGAGELHLRPLLDLRQGGDVRLFERISKATAELVKKYKGSLSGEHGDGRVRAPFIEDMVGSEVYAHFIEMKKLWDPDNIFNPGKIVHALPQTSDLRLIEDSTLPEIKTSFSFDEQGGILRAAEKCNGSGDCRKLAEAGGTMCPSYQATRDEKDTTRARANVLREVLTRSGESNKFDSGELKEVMELCLSCKACKHECPSRVDMALMKSEFLYQFHKNNKRPLRDALMASSPVLAQRFGVWYNIGQRLLNSTFGGMVKSLIGIHPKRAIPGAKVWRGSPSFSSKMDETVDVVLYVDEFTGSFDSPLIEMAGSVLIHLGYKVWVSPIMNSGRGYISKGFLTRAKKEAEDHLTVLKSAIENGKPIVGIEPSAILTLRDELPKLVEANSRQAADELSQLAMTFEEFLWQEFEKGKWHAEKFTREKTNYHIHGHCHFKAIGREDSLYQLISALPGSSAYKIPSGCCGMAGSFGYEKEKYELSMKIGAETLFPYLKKLKVGDHIVAHGTSCRQQILDGMDLRALHPVEVMYSRMNIEYSTSST